VSRRRSPAPLGDVLREAVAGAAPDTLLARVQAVWPRVAGAAVAAEAAPGSEREGTITIECSSAVWAHELDLLGPELLGRLNGVLEGAPVRRLRFVVQTA
jgi:predicted nucleic acid-binding Zn ribbon protein